MFENVLLNNLYMKIKLRFRNSELQSFVRYLFKNNKNNCIMVSRVHELGLFICAHVCYKDTPDLEHGDIVSELVLPHAMSTISAERKYCFFTHESTGKINDFIAAIMKADFERYWINGRILGLKKKDIIESYILTRGVFNINAESKGKVGYRIDIKTMSTVVKSYYDRANFIDNKIQDEQLKYKKSCYV